MVHDGVVGGDQVIVDAVRSIIMYYLSARLIPHTAGCGWAAKGNELGLSCTKLSISWCWSCLFMFCSINWIPADYNRVGLSG